MARVTSKAIGKAIEKKTGIKHVGLFNGGGYHYFYSDDDEVGAMLCGWQSTSVYVYHMSDFTVDEWVEQFEYLMKNKEDYSYSY